MLISAPIEGIMYMYFADVLYERCHKKSSRVLKASQPNSGFEVN